MTTARALTARPSVSRKSNAPARAVRPPQSSSVDFERNGDFGAEFLRLGEGAAGQRLAGNAGGKAEIILDARGSAGLAAESALVEHDHRKPLRGGIDGGRQPGRPGADHGDVVDECRIELGRDAEADAGLGVARPLEHRAVGADHQRQFAGAHAEALDQAVRFLVGIGIQHGVGIAVAREKALQTDEVGRTAPVDQQRAGAAVLDQRHPAQDEGAHQQFADFGRADHQRADMRGIERNGGAAIRAGMPGGDGAAAARVGLSRR